jgi:hypothetical protein
VVALSSCEAEYIAAMTASIQALWLARLLGDLLGKYAEAVELRVDSKSTLALVKNHVFYEHSKHIRIKYHFIRSCLDEGTIGVYLRNVRTTHANKFKFLWSVKLYTSEGINIETIHHFY